MTTNRTADTGRLTIAEAKRLILESSPRESFVQVYRREDGTLQTVPDAEPKSIFAGFLDEDFAANCAQLGIVPRWKYRPGKTGYAGDPATDELYTISRDELAQLADLHGLTLEVGVPPSAEPVPLADEAPDPQRRLAALRALGGNATRMNGNWSFTKINELTANEKANRRKRSDQKTIRRDLEMAAKAEREEGPKPSPPSMFPT